MTKVFMIELSGSNPLSEFQAWFFGSMAVLFVGLLTAIFMEMRAAIKVLTSKSINYERDIEVIKRDLDYNSKKNHEHDLWIAENDKIMRQVNANLVELNTTLKMINRKTDDTHFQ